MNIFKWFIDLPYIMLDIYEVLFSKVFVVGDMELTFLALVAGEVIFAIITAKIVALAIPG